MKIKVLLPFLFSFLFFSFSWFELKAEIHDPRVSTPNVVVIFIDDLGYADIGPFGANG